MEVQLMKKIIIEVQEDTLDQATGVLEDLGLDVESAVRMFLKRVVKDQSVAFVLPSANAVRAPQPIVERVAPQTETVKTDRGEMRKTLAVKMFREQGRYIDKNVTYSSKNRTTYNYWSNPNFSVLEEDWTFILNDWVNRKLYLFRIPRNSISAPELVGRNDQPDLIDIQILEDNPNFVDRRSNFSFRRFLIDEMDY